jgi:hypothetical protein
LRFVGLHRTSGLIFLVRHETDEYVGDLEPGVKEDTSVGDNFVENLHLLFPAPEAISEAWASVDFKNDDQERRSGSTTEIDIGGQN